MSEARDNLIRNLTALMAQSPDLNGQAPLARKSKVAIGTINNLLNDPQGMEPTISTVEKLAHAFGLATWQLLHPSLTLADHEAKLYARFRELIAAERDGPAYGK